MIEADYSTMDMAMQPGNGDETLMVKFFYAPLQDAAATKTEGRPIYKETIFISIRVPGDKDSDINRPIRPADKMRFPEHWRRFEAREDQDAITGTLLSEWPGITRSQAEELKFFNVRTVEQLVNMADSHGQNLMGFNILKQRAVKFLEQAKVLASAEEVAKRDEIIASLTARLEALEGNSVAAPEAEAETKTNKRRRAKPATDTAQE